MIGEALRGLGSDTGKFVKLLDEPGDGSGCGEEIGVQIQPS